MGFLDFLFGNKGEKSIFPLEWQGNTIKGLFFPSKPSSYKTGIIYCHGGFGGTGPNKDYADAIVYSNAGFPTYVVSYEKEGTHGIRIDVDVQEVYDAGQAFKEKFKFDKIVLLGVSRGGFVALQTMAQHYDFFDMAVIHVSPTHLPSWIEIARKLKQIPTLETEVIPYFDWQKDLLKSSPISYAPNYRSKPMLLNYGNQDKVVPNGTVDLKYWQGEMLWRAIGNGKSKCAYKIWPHGHGLALEREVIVFNINWIKAQLALLGAK